MSSSADIFSAIDALGAKFHHEFVEQGYEFTYRGTKIRVVKVGKLEERNRVSSVVEAGGKYWMLQLVGTNEDGLKGISAGFKGVVDFVAVDHYCLMQR
jgi:hypothetical protein